MATATSQIAPESPEQAAELLRDAGGPVRIVGAGTKRRWGSAVQERGPSPFLHEDSARRVLSTRGLAEIVEHNAGDLTAIVQAGVTLGRLRETFAEAGQMLALDPPGDDATIGGIVATGDSGPLRHRYGGPRDLVLGVAIALPDGTVARAGGKVIKNVAGYDLAKLMTGAFGTLGVIAQVALRLHPIPRNEVTVIGETNDPRELAGAATAASHARLEAQSLDVDWRGDQGMVLMRFGGVAADKQAKTAATLLEEHGAQTSVIHDDDSLWRRQAERQRDQSGTVVRVSGTQTQLASVLGAASIAGATVVGRVSLGLSWVCLPSTADGDAIATMVRDMRRTLAPAACVVLDRQDGVDVDPWGVEEGPELELMRRTKERFDPRGVCNPGVYVGGI